MKLACGEVIIKKLVKEGVQYILGIPGHGILGMFDAVRREEEAGNIKYIQVKHEQAAAAIADGYFRVSGKPLAVFASISPGTLNLGIGLGTAYTDNGFFGIVRRYSCTYERHRRIAGKQYNKPLLKKR